MERWGELATSDWLNRDNWVGSIFELTEGDDGFFKKARCTDLSDFSFKDSLILVLKRNSPDFGGNSPWGLRVLLEGRSEFDAKLYITGVESVIHITFHTHEEGVDGEHMRWCDDLDIDQAVDFIKTLNREGAIKTMKNLPLPPWRK